MGPKDEERARRLAAALRENLKRRKAQAREVGSCLSCGHPIGYHHAGTVEEMFCTVKDCACLGYDSETLPRAERHKPVEKPE